MSEEEFKKKIDELDLEFKKWDKGITDKESKIGEPTKLGEKPISREKSELQKAKEIAEQKNVKFYQENPMIRHSDSNFLHSESPLEEEIEEDEPEPDIMEKTFGSKRSKPIPRYTPTRYRKRKNTKVLFLIAFLAAQPLVFYVVFTSGMFNILSPGEPARVNPIVILRDGITNEDLDLDYFTCNLFGSNSPPSDWESIELIGTMELDDLFRGDLIGYEYYFIQFYGNVEGMIYNEQWTQIYPNSPGSIVLTIFAMPSSFWINVLDSNMTLVNSSVSSNIFVLTCANESETGKALLGFHNYELDEFTMPQIRVTFENEVLLSDFEIVDPSLNKLPERRYSLTALEYTVFLDSSYDVYSGKWNVPGNRIVNVQLVFDEQILASW